jgi:hypothetical protein
MRTGRFRFVERRKHLFSRKRVQVLQVEISYRGDMHGTFRTLEWIDASPSDAANLAYSAEGKLLRYATYPGAFT